METVKHVVDGLAAGVTIATILQWLPALAALFTLFWTALRILEMVTGKTISELLKNVKQ